MRRPARCFSCCADEIFASAGHDNFRFLSIADSAAGAADTIHSFDAGNDSFTFSGIGVAGGHIESWKAPTSLAVTRRPLIC